MKRLITKQGIAKYGTKESIISQHVFKKVRERLSLTEEELPNSLIRSVIKLGNKELGKFVVDNAEGYMLKDMGVIAASKHLPKEFRGDKEDIIEKIKNYDIPDIRRNQLLKRYNVDIGRRIDYDKLLRLGQLIPHLNMNSYFYTYRLMWFNKRNTTARKGDVYEFKPTRELNSYFADRIWGGKDYYEWTFTDFYRHKLKAKY